MLMTMHEFGQENKDVIVMVHPLGVQWDVFEYVMPYIDKNFHVVIPAIPGMDPDQPNITYTSVEEIASELESWLQQRGHSTVNCLFGCSMGGAVVVRMIANAQITSKHIIIDGGMTPYQLPKIFTYVIGVRDWCMMELGKHTSTKMLRGLFSEEKYSEQDIVYIKKCLSSMSAKTIWRAFYSCNNYSMPPKVKQPTCRMQYWYGSEEKKARKWDIDYIRKTFPEMEFVENPGIGHAEYFTLHPQKFAEQLLAFCAET